MLPGSLSGRKNIIGLWKREVNPGGRKAAETVFPGGPGGFYRRSVANSRGAGYTDGEVMNLDKTEFGAFDGDALFGYPRIMVKTLSRQPNPYGSGYISDYIWSEHSPAAGSV